MRAAEASHSDDDLGARIADAVLRAFSPD
jgi:hypothetical protein